MVRSIGMRILVTVFVVIALSGCATEDPAAGFVRDTGNPADALVESKCSMCHTTERVFAASKTAEEWDSTMQRMERNGMVITDDDYNQILGYLGK